MKILIISFGLIAMTGVLTEALTFHARRAQVNDNPHTLQDTSEMKRASSPLALSKDSGLVTKRQGNPTCEDWVKGIRAVLISAEKSLGDPRPPVTVFSEAIPCKSDPNQSVLDILTDLVKRIAQTRTDITTAFGGGVDPKTTTATKAQVDAIATTATALAAELKNVQSSLVAGNSIPYNDLIIYVDNIVAYTDGYINGNCFTFTD